LFPTVGGFSQPADAALTSSAVTDTGATHGEVRLVVPALPEYLRLARLTAAGLASRLGFSYDEVEDLRIAIDELCFVLVGSHGRPGSITLVYSMLPDALVVEGSGAFPENGPAFAGVSELSGQILAAVVDEHEVRAGQNGPTFRLRKRHAN
jgi:serine/threonine-protein kinase RsbW